MLHVKEIPTLGQFGEMTGFIQFTVDKGGSEASHFFLFLINVKKPSLRLLFLHGGERWRGEVDEEGKKMIDRLEPCGSILICKENNTGRDGKLFDTATPCYIT